MEKKMTKKDMFTLIANSIDQYLSECGEGYGFTGEMVTFIDHEIDLLSKKSANKKQTKKQEQNVELKDAIIKVLATFENGATASEVLTASEDFSGLSNQKISAMLNQLVAEGRADKTTDKKKSIFSVVATD